MRTLFTLLTVFIFAVQVSAQTSTMFGYRNPENATMLNLSALCNGENNYLYALAMDYVTYDNFLVKLDENGTAIWQKKIYDGNDMSYPIFNQAKYFNNHIYVIGTLQSAGLQYVLSKIDLNGNLVWSKYLTPVDQYMYTYPSIEITAGHGIVVASSANSSIDLFSLNEDGSIHWVKNCNSDSTAVKNPNFDIAVTDNGDIMGCAKAESDMSFYRMNSSGQLKWSSRILEMNNSYTHVKSIVEINDNKFLICGYRYEGFSTLGGFYAIMDSSGVFIDFRMVPEFGEIRNGYVLNNGHILLFGYSSMDSQSQYLEIEDTGNPVAGFHANFISSIYSPIYNGIVEKNGYIFMAEGSAIQRLSGFTSFDCNTIQPVSFTYVGSDPGSLPSAGYFAFHPGGSVQDNINSQSNTSNLELEVGCANIMDVENNISSTSFQIFPTLLHNNESIIVNHELNEPIEYQITDLNGKRILQNQLVNNSIPITNLSAGMYVIQFATNGNVVHTNKFVVN